MPELTPSGMFNYVEEPWNLLREPLRQFQREAEVAILAASGGSGFGLADPGSNGLVVRTSVGATVARTLVQPSSGMIISEPAGSGGNPTFSLANDLAAIEALSTTGYVKRTATDTWSTVAASAIATDLLGASTNGQVIFNDGGAFGGDGGLTYNKATDALTVNGSLGVLGTAPATDTGIKISNTSLALGAAGTYGIDVAVGGTGTNSFFGYNAGRFSATYSGTGDLPDHPNATGLQAYASYTGASGRADYIQAFGAQASSGATGYAEILYGALVNAVAFNAAQVGGLFGITSQVSFSGTANSAASSAINNCFLAKVYKSSTGSVPFVAGYYLGGWSASGGAPGTSYGIYADASIDIGTAKYFIYSLSNSPSILSGDLSITRAGATLTVTSTGSSGVIAVVGGSTSSPGSFQARNSEAGSLAMSCLGSGGTSSSFPNIPSASTIQTFVVNGLGIGTTNSASTAELRFHTGGFSVTPRWKFTSTGHFIPGVDFSYDIGSTTFRPRNIYCSVDPNFIPRVSSASALINSQITDDGTEIFITASLGSVSISAGYIAALVAPDAVVQGDSTVIIRSMNGDITIGDDFLLGGGIRLLISQSSGLIFSSGNIVPETGGLALGATDNSGWSTVWLANGGNKSIALTGTASGTNKTTTFPNANTFIPVATQLITFAGLTTGRTITFQDANQTLARIDAAQTFTGIQTFSTPIAPSSGGTGTATVFTSGSIVFAGASGIYSQNNSKLFWDNTNFRLGVGLVSPAHSLSVQGGNGEGTIAKFSRDGVGGEKDFYIGSSNVAYVDLGSEGAFRMKVGVTADLPYSSGVDGLMILATGNVGVNTITPRKPLDVLSNSQAQLRLSYTDNSVYTDFAVGSGGTLTVSPTGNFEFSTTGKLIVPALNYSENLGSLSKKYLTLHAAELWVETLVAQSTLATIGGRILVGPTTVLTSDLSAGATSIVVKHNQMSSGDRVYMEANGSVEFMAITSAPSGSGPYTYTVTRDLDGTGANAWSAGDAVFNTGQTGSGFIDLYSVRGVKNSGQVGPTIVGNIRNSSTYNDWSEHWAIGNLNGLYGYGSDTPGVGLGQYAASKAHITVDATNGLRIFTGLSTVVGQWNALGVITVGQVAASQSNVLISSGVLELRNNTTARIRLAADGSGFLANSLIAWDTSGNLTVTGNATIAGWTINSTNIAKDTGTNATSSGMAPLDFPFFAGATVANRATAPFRVTPAGALVATSATITGSITATTGAIGGWSIGATALTSGSGATTVGLDSGGTNPAIYAGSATPGSAPFRVTNAGALTATNANITGTITATAGTIAGWTISTTALTKNEVTIAAGVNAALVAGTGEAWIGKSVSGYYGIIAKGTTAANAQFVAGNSSIGSSGRPYLSINDGTRYRIVLGELNTTVWDGVASNAMGMKIWDSAGAKLVEFSDVLNAIAGWTISTTKISSTGIDLISGASAGLAFGTTPPTSASVGTGIWLDRTGLYGLAANVVQAKFDATTGKISAGAGTAILDVSGLSFLGGTGSPNRIKWYDGSFGSNEIGAVSSSRVATSGGLTQASLMTLSPSGDTTGSAAIFIQSQNNSGSQTQWVVYTNGSSAGNNGFVTASGNGSGYTFSGMTVGTNSAPGAMLDVRGGIISTSLTAGSVLFAGTGGLITQDNTNLFFDDTNNRLGLGTASPSEPFHFRKNQNANSNFLIENQTSGTAAVITYMAKNDAGLVAQLGMYSSTTTTAGALVAGDAFVYTTSNGLTIVAGGASGVIKMATGGTTLRLTLSAAGLLRLHAYGAGTLTTDGSGNVTATSDEALKIIVAPFDAGLAALRSIEPILYRWREGDESGLVYPGFSAQNVRAAIPQAVGIDSRGYLGLQDRGLIGALVNAVKELDKRLWKQQAELEDLRALNERLLERNR